MAKTIAQIRNEWLQIHNNLSVVGIKGDTLIVQNPNLCYDTKYQKLSINDLFEGCKNEKGEGSDCRQISQQKPRTFLDSES